MKPTFEVDKEGLAKLLERRGRPFAVAELIQNAWDEASTHVEVRLYQPPGDPDPTDGKGWPYILEVEDDNPEGFKDLSHAYTLFAESEKAGNPEQRGRFNLGEKLVIAICDEAKIHTTKGTVIFEREGRRHTDTTREAGSLFVGALRLTTEDVEEIERTVFSLLPPAGVVTLYNGAMLAVREPVATFQASLRTELADPEGYIRPTQRKTEIRLFEPGEGEAAHLYEMGIPVVETGDRWHVDIGQKVPLTTDRDNVPPFYLRDVRTHVLNNAHKLLTPEEAGEKWVDAALADEKIQAGAAEAALQKRFGDKRVAYDPTDPEANNLAVAQGYTLVPGRALSKEAWKQVKRHEAILPAGQVTPSPNPHEGAENISIMQPEHYPESVGEVVAYAKRLARLLLDREVKVRIANAPQWPFRGTYGQGRLTLNLGRLGFSFFDHAADCPEADVPLNELLIHEFAHEFSSNHLDESFHDACCMLGARFGRAMFRRVGLEKDAAFAAQAASAAAAAKAIEKGGK